MTTMFDNFSFDSASRHPSQPAYTYPSVSPTSTPSPSAAPHLAIADLTRRLDASALADHPPPTTFHLPSSPSLSASTPLDHPASSPRSASDPFPGPVQADHRAIRARRQAGARLHCSPRHLREISALVARMVRAGEPCASVASAALTVDSAGRRDEAEDGTGDERAARRARSFDGGRREGGGARSGRVSKRRGKVGSVQKS